MISDYASLTGLGDGVLGLQMMHDVHDIPPMRSDQRSMNAIDGGTNVEFICWVKRAAIVEVASSDRSAILPTIKLTVF
jgi:hypothetical protein